jgi:hypothetical protein
MSRLLTASGWLAPSQPLSVFPAIVEKDVPPVLAPMKVLFVDLMNTLQIGRNPESAAENEILGFVFL